MNFAERFKGKTSTITKEGLSALVQSSQVPIFKTTGFQGMAPPDDSRQAAILASITTSQNNMYRPLLPQQKKGFSKYPSTWRPTSSSKDQVPKLVNFQALPPVRTQTNTPLTDRPSWTGHPAVAEAESSGQSIVPRSAYVKNSKLGLIERQHTPSVPQVQILKRSQSITKERISKHDYSNPNIRPSYADIVRKTGQKPLVQTKAYNRETSLRTNSRNAEEVIYTENQESNWQRQLSNADGNIQPLRRAISQRELVDRETYSRQHVYPNQPKKVPESSVIAQLIESNVAKYMNSLYGVMSHHNKGFTVANSVQSLENDPEQQPGATSMIERRRDMTPVTMERPDINNSNMRNPESSRQILHNINQKIGKAAETRVTFRGGDIIDRMKLHSEDRSRRSNSNDSFVRAQPDQREGSPFLRFTGRRMEKVDISKA